MIIDLNLNVLSLCKSSQCQCTANQKVNLKHRADSKLAKNPSNSARHKPPKHIPSQTADLSTYEHHEPAKSWHTNPHRYTNPDIGARFVHLDSHTIERTIQFIDGAIAMGGIGVSMTSIC